MHRGMPSGAVSHRLAANRVMEASVDIERLLSIEQLPEQYRQVIADVHVPIANALAARTRQSTENMLIAGLCGAQGSGKSTMALVLKGLLEEQGIGTAVISLDDFYLTRPERTRLAETVHPLLATRGVPGTHDVDLALRTLDALSEQGTIALPSFDKAQDDRKPEHDWPRIRTPVRLAILEGWCIGVAPESHPALEHPINTLEREFDPQGAWRRYVNEQLGSVYQQLFRRLDTLIFLQAPTFEVVYGWRLEQEQKLRERVGSGSTRIMGEAEIATFIQYYERLTRHILNQMPERADIVVRLDEHRQVTSVRTRSSRGGTAE